MKRRTVKLILQAAMAWLAISAFTATTMSCGSSDPHSGRIPFSLLEAAPRKPRGADGSVQRMRVVASMNSSGPPSERAAAKRRLRPGDVVVFYMPRRESFGHLVRFNVQKFPYDLFRYGHLALIVPDPAGGDSPKLLQVAMRQAVTASAGLEYFDDKHWAIYRPPEGSVDVARLGEFTRTVVAKAADSKSAYDYSGAFGLANAAHRPEKPDEIGTEYTCTTLVVAGLHFSGFHLDSTWRGGVLDIVTPRQVVDSWGESP